MGDKLKQKYLKSLFTRVLISIILFLVSSIFINYSDKNLLLYKKHLYNKSFNFAYINKIYDKYLGGILPLKNVSNKEQVVMSETIDYSNNEPYQNGIKINALSGHIIKSLESGIIVFIGEKENLGNTIIIQGSDGVDYWYGNIENSNLSIYDYIEKDTNIGNAKDGILYLQFAKNGEYLNYEEFI